MKYMRINSEDNMKSTREVASFQMPMRAETDALRTVDTTVAVPGLLPPSRLDHSPIAACNDVKLPPEPVVGIAARGS